MTSMRLINFVAGRRFLLCSVSSPFWAMPRTKQRSIRRRKRVLPHQRDPKCKAPLQREKTARVSPAIQSPHDAVVRASSMTSLTSPSVSTPAPTASVKKLSASPHATYGNSSSESEVEECKCDGKGARILEVSGLQSALEGVCCKHCGSGPIVFREDVSKRQGLYTSPFLYCESCTTALPILFSACSSSKALAINRRAVLANKCAGGSHSSLEYLFALLDLPPPVSRNIYSLHMDVVCDAAVAEVQDSLQRAREEVREHYGASSGDEVIDILVSCDGTWQKRGFSSLFGAVFVIAYETGKVVDYIALSKHCAGCKLWDDRDKSSTEYAKWKANHDCAINFSGSAGAMEPIGTLKIFQRSLDHCLRYKSLISDGDSKTFSLLESKQVYGTDSDDKIVKLDCIGHVQKRLGTALRNLKAQYRGKKLSDGKSIGGAGRLTDLLINSLQNYYGSAIRHGKDSSVQVMVKAVKATLLHCNSTDEAPRHHLCPAGEKSWCKWQVAQAKGEEYHHHKAPIPEAILQLLKPIYDRLGSPTLLEKCIHGYTQNANESLHSLVWKLCPKELFLGKTSVDTACAMAVCRFNDGALSLRSIAHRLQLETSTFCDHTLTQKDKQRISNSRYKCTEAAKRLRKRARRKRKGLDDRHQEREGPMYIPGGFDSGEPGPSKRLCTRANN